MPLPFRRRGAADRRKKPTKAAFKVKTIDILFKEIPKEIRDAWKAYCTQRGITMKQRLVELMKMDILRQMEKTREHLRGDSQ